MGEDIKNDLAGIAITHPFFAAMVTNALNYIEELEKENKELDNDNTEWRAKYVIQLAKIDDLQKENEELKTTNKIIINKEIRNGQPTLSGTRLTIIDILLLMIDFVRDYEKEFRANYADISVEQIILVFDYFIDNSIPVQKVKEKIEELDIQISECEYADDDIEERKQDIEKEKRLLLRDKKTLEELLGKE